MTKKELIELMKDMNDDYEVSVNVRISDPGGFYGIIAVYEHPILKKIELELNED
jgi:hypothetical protein